MRVALPAGGSDQAIVCLGLDGAALDAKLPRQPGNWDDLEVVAGDRPPPSGDAGLQGRCRGDAGSLGHPRRAVSQFEEAAAHERISAGSPPGSIRGTGQSIVRLTAVRRLTPLRSGASDERGALDAPAD